MEMAVLCLFLKLHHLKLLLCHDILRNAFGKEISGSKTPSHILSCVLAIPLTFNWEVETYKLTSCCYNMKIKPNSLMKTYPHPRLLGEYFC